MKKITDKTIEQENPALIPSLIAELVAEKAVIHKLEKRLDNYSNLSVKLQNELNNEYKSEVQRVTAYLVERANTVYQHNKKFRKDVRGAGNKGRDTLNLFMYHWVGFHSDNQGASYQPVKSGQAFQGYSLSIELYYKYKALHNS